MNPEEEDERAMPSDQNTDGTTQAGGPSEAVPSDGTARPGVTDVQAYIGRQLRAVYDDVVKQPIPDRFLALMKQLEDGTPGS